MIRGARQAFGLLLASLALVAQLTLAVAMPAPTMSLVDVTVLCHQDGNQEAPAAPSHQSPDCMLCFFCHNAAGPAALLASPPLLPAPEAKLVARAAILPPATAPPARIVLAARPRGPPTRV